MPSVSEKQMRFMGMALAAKRGKLAHPSKKVMEAARGMSESVLSDFASKAGNKKKRLGIAKSTRNH